MLVIINTMRPSNCGCEELATVKMSERCPMKRLVQNSWSLTLRLVGLVTAIFQWLLGTLFSFLFVDEDF